jgi:hypothetical protein
MSSAAYSTGDEQLMLRGRLKREDLAMLDEFAVGLAGARRERGEPEHVGGGIIGR